MKAEEPEKRKKPGNPGVSQERRAELLRRMIDGEDAKSLCGKVGLSRQFLMKLLKDAMRASAGEQEPISPPAWLKNTRRVSISKAQREEITRRAIAGEKMTKLGREFDVSRSYVSLLRKQALYPEKFGDELKLKKKLTSSEIAEFKDVLASSIPTDHDLIPHSDDWSIDHGFQLAERLFKKHPSKRTIAECLAPYLVERCHNYFPRPQPPKAPHPSQIHPDLAKDPDFVAYYMSPLAQQIAQKEYEFALADYEARFGTDEERAQVAAEKRVDAPRQLSKPGKRLGKHANSKGSPFTPPKRRKKRS